MALEPLFPAEENNEVSWYTSGLAGIYGGFKNPGSTNFGNFINPGK